MHTIHCFGQELCMQDTRNNDAKFLKQLQTGVKYC